MTIKVKGRLAFPNIFEPHPNGGKFGATIIFEPGGETDLAVQAEIQKVMNEKWQGKITSPSQLRQFCYKDGSTKSQYDGFEGMKFISANLDAQPTVIDADGVTPVTKQSGKVYPGCYVVAYVEIWAQDNQYGKGVNAALRGVQFWKDGVSFGGTRPMDTSEFEALGDVEPAAPAGGMFG